MRKQYIAIKETPEVKVGAIFEEDCDAGNQGFHLITPEFRKFPKDQTQQEVCHGRQIIMKQPEYFEEVCTVRVPKNKVAAVTKFLKK